MWQICKRGDVHVGYGGEGRNLRKRHHLEDLGINGTITLKQNKEIGWDRIPGLIWLQIATSGRLL